MFHAHFPCYFFSYRLYIFRHICENTDQLKIISHFQRQEHALFSLITSSCMQTYLIFNSPNTDIQEDQPPRKLVKFTIFLFMMVISHQMGPSRPINLQGYLNLIPPSKRCTRERVESKPIYFLLVIKSLFDCHYIFLPDRKGY